MKKYKYFFISDSKKEAVGKVTALTQKRAIQKAAQIKRLSTNHFLELFNVEEIHE
jgi:hypothetical protein